MLSPVTRTLYPEEDDAVLEYLQEEGQSIEPSHYLPIVPTVLVNGAEGIGTGWSTFIPQFNPRDLVENVKRLMRGEDLERMEPWYKGYFGSIEPVDEQRESYVVTGRYNITKAADAG